MKKLIVMFIVLLMTHSVMQAGAKGSASAVFLKIAPDARGAAMGESMVAIADDVNAVHWNPAGLVHAKGIQGSFTHMMGLFDTSFDYLAGSLSLPGLGSFGISAKLYTLPDLDEYDSLGNELASKVESGDMAVGVSYARQIIPMLSAGITIKYISETLAGVSGTGFGFDIGGLMKLGSVNVGAGVDNVGSKLQFNDRENNLPMKIKAGGAYCMEMSGTLKGINLGVGIELPNDNDITFNAGSEFLMKLGTIGAALRLGAILPKDGGLLPSLTMGGGITMSRIGIDYAFHSAGSDVGSTHRFTLIVKY
ncbi:MAG: PorV/PorQ family protein [Spirochaetes bacterium]|nr:PorV/PorQ family protein [Spirochaetota bacterium]